MKLLGALKHMDNNELENSKKEIEDIKKTLEETKQLLLDVKSNANNARQTIVNIEAFNKKLTEIKDNIENPTDGIIVNNNNSKIVKAEIDVIRTTSEETLNQIKNNLASVQANIALMEKEYNSFLEINSKIINPENGLIFLLNSSKTTKSEIDTIKIASDTSLSQIKQELSSIQANIVSISEAYTNFTEIKKKIDNPTSGLLAILSTSEISEQDILAVKTQCENLFIDIKKTRDEAIRYTKETEDLKNTSEENKNLILGYENQSKDLKNKIEKIYKITTDAGLANSFDERKQGLGKSTNRWFLSLLISTSILSISLFVILWPLLWNNITAIDGYTWYRLTLTSPIIFFITFASVQYNKERTLLEKYAFKAATALSLEGYTTLLINTFDKEKEVNEKEILGFVLNSMSTIYQEPYEPTKESKFTFGIDSSLASFKGDFTKTMEETKKSLIKTVKEEITKTGKLE